MLLKNAGSPVVIAAFGLALGVAAPASADVAPPSNKEPYVVFTVGDSYAAGEGAPEVPGNYGDNGHLPFSNPRPEDWDTDFPNFTSGSTPDPRGIATERCHRSPLSTSGVAVGYLGADFPDINVIFNSVACSGGSLVAGGRLDRNNPSTGNSNPKPHPGGVLRPYSGEDVLQDFNPRPDTSVPFPAQLNQIDAHLNDRSFIGFERLDALIVGAGGNDAGFGSVVEACADVPLSASPGQCNEDDALIAFREARLALLDETRPGGSSVDRYDRLAGSLESNKRNADDAELDSDHVPHAVLLTAIPRITRKSSTTFCSGEPAGDETNKVTGGEAAFVENTFRVPLNEAMEHAAAEHGWEFVTSHVDDFTGHAICQTDRWINTNKDALRKQGRLPVELFDFSGGWVHPNARGYEQMGGALYRRLAGQLVNRFMPTSGPLLFSEHRADGMTVGQFFNPTLVRSTTSGNYLALKLLQVSSTGVNSPVAGADGFQLLGYGQNSAVYQRTGRYLVVGRSCAPLSRDASIGCGPPFQLRMSTLIPQAPIEVVGQAASQTLDGGVQGIAVQWRHANAGAAHDTTFSFVRVRGTQVGNQPFDQTFKINGRRTGASLGSLPFGSYNVSVQSCNQNLGCSTPTAAVSIGTGLIKGFDPNAVRVAGYTCPVTNVAWGVPPKVLPARNGTGGTITLVDPFASVLPPCLDQPVGRLSVRPRRQTTRPGRLAKLILGWEHPVRWGELRTVEMRLRSGRRILSTLTFNQNKNTLELARGARSDGQRTRLPRRSRKRLRAGAVTVLAGRGTFRRPALATRAVRLRLGMVFGRALAGRRLSLEIAASNDAGERQAFARGGTIRVRRR